MKIKRRYPNYFTGFDETEHEVNSLSELLEIPWIKEFYKNPDFLGLFYSKGLCDDSPDLLMAVWNNNEEGIPVIYFIVGYIYGNGQSLGLEEFGKTSK